MMKIRCHLLYTNNTISFWKIYRLHQDLEKTAWRHRLKFGTGVEFIGTQVTKRFGLDYLKTFPELEYFHFRRDTFFNFGLKIKVFAQNQQN